MSTGKIWPEYWIDCSVCDFHEPLAVSKAPAREARKRGWGRLGMVGPWVCGRCQFEARAAHADHRQGKDAP
jgi:hypothetical protein